MKTPKLANERSEDRTLAAAIMLYYFFHEGRTVSLRDPYSLVRDAADQASSVLKIVNEHDVLATRSNLEAELKHRDQSEIYRRVTTGAYRAEAKALNEASLEAFVSPAAFMH